MNLETMKKQMTDKAHAHHEAMQGMSEKAAFRYIKNIITNADVMVGIRQDFAEPNGVGLHVIKGQRALAGIVASGEAERLRWEAVPCTEVEQAIATQNILGDGAQKLA